MISEAIAIRKGGDPNEIATRIWGAGRPPPGFEIRTGVSGSVSGDASPFATESAAFFESVSADSIVAAMELRRVPFYARLVSVASSASASWTGKSRAKPISRRREGLSKHNQALVAAISIEICFLTKF